MIANIRILSLVVVAALALTLSACGGGGGNGPVTDMPMPKAVNLDSVAANAMRPATEEPIVIAPGQSTVHGDVAFSCAAGGPTCMVAVAEDGTASSTGGMVTATNSEAFVQRTTVANAIGVAGAAVNALSLTSSDAQVAAAESLLVAAKTALEGATALSMADRDALNGRIQTVETTLVQIRMAIADARYSIMELEPTIEAISAAIDKAEFLTDALSRTSSDADVGVVEALLENVRATLEAFPPGAILDPLYWRLRIVEMTLASIKTDIAAHRAAVANAIDLAANDNRQDELGEFIGGRWWREPGIGGQQASVTRSYDGGGSVNAILSYDETGQLQHNVAIFQNKSYQLLETTDIRVRVDRAGRHINTREDPQELEGVTRSTRSIFDHGLGAEWQVTELTSDYDGGGTLKINVATDLEPTDGSVDPFATVTAGHGNIEFSEAPVLPADRDFLVVRFDPGYGVEGSLGDDVGFFYCPIAEDCYLTIDRRSGGYYAVSTGLTFTPEGGTAQPVPSILADTLPAADYLAFGHWLYVPDDAAEPDDVPPTLGYDFGVFASGGDPFTAANLRGLTGTATYEGDAAGMYYVGGLSGRPDVGSFTADVELTANFGSNVETGTISGQVGNFEFEGDVASSLPDTLRLASRTYDYLPEGFGVEQGTTNIFDTPWRDEVVSYPGGWVGGATQASLDGQDWYGSWSGAFYGNGPAPTDHPTSVAGEFGSYPWGNGNHNQRDTGLTGSFGAHR